MGILKQNDDNFFLNSKLAKRIFTMFVLCSILPLLAISTVSFFFVGHQLETQAGIRLQQQCKNMGLLIYERLLNLEEELKIAARDVVAGRSKDIEKHPFNPLSREGSGLHRIVLLMPDGHRLPVVDHAPDLPAAELGKAPQPDEGQTIIGIRDGKKGYPLIYLFRKISLLANGNAIIAGEVNPLYLWGIGTEGALPPGIDMTVVQDENKTLISSIPNYKIDESFLKAHKQRAFSGSFQSVHDGNNYINSYWSLFLKHRFSSPQWIFTFSQSRASIMAPVFNFKFIFFMLVLLTFWIILLLSLRAIRNRTIPVEKLKAGALQIASGRFGLQLDISSGDEFEDLAQTFNEMSTKLQQGQAMLMQAAKMSTFGQMGAGIVHEIGQPLTAISGYAELLKMGAAPEKQQHFLSTICREAQRLKTIISKFRTFSRVSEEVFTRIDINQVLDNTLDLLEHQFKIHRVELEDDRENPLFPVVGDSNGLQQVFLNLLTNALDAMDEKPEGQRRIRISSRTVDGLVRLEISDSGPGIPQEIAQRIYDPFFTTKGEEKGTGLGLAISSSIMHKHNAEITFDSEENEGTTFTLTFPAADASRETPHTS